MRLDSPPASPGTKHTVPLVARVWKDYQIPSNGFCTVTTSFPSGWRCEIGRAGGWLASDIQPTEGAAQSQVVALANKKWPLSA